MAYIYGIFNNVNGKVYIGATGRDLRRRFREHMDLLERRKHYNPHLQATWNKHGSANFSFSELEECSAAQLKSAEKTHMLKHNSEDHAHGYNMNSAGLCGKLSEAARDKISHYQRHRKRGPRSESKKLKLADANRGKKRGPHSTATKSKMSLAATGRTISKEQRHKISVSLTGRKTGSRTRDERHKISIGGSSAVVREDGVVFESAYVAAEYNQVTAHGIRRCCRGIRKTCVGYKWKYE